MNHIAQSSLEGYVMCTLADEECAIVEAHVASCETCAARLQREARFELAFAEVAARSEERPRRMHYIAPAIGGALAMAAAMILWMAPHESASEQRTPTVEDQTASEMNADASTMTATLEREVDGSRIGVKD